MQKKMSRKYRPLVSGMMLLLSCCAVVVAQGQETGEWATLFDGSPAMSGQSTQDHLFVRNTYDSDGLPTTFDNIVSFKSGPVQTVWFWLDDDEIYLNEAIQRLIPEPYDNQGHLYQEITYNSVFFNIYLPEGIRLVKGENEEGDEMIVEQGMRLPASACPTWSITENDDTRVIDGITYINYTVCVYNTEEYGTHFSARNAEMYQRNGALKKDDAALLGLYLQNDNQDKPEGQLADMIIANVEFNLKEPARDGWETNDSRFIYCTGGNNETQRFQLFHRVALYGSKGLEPDDVLVDSISLDVAAISLNINETYQLTATVMPEAATEKTVTWTSSDENVATVHQDGLVTAIAPGTATITATTTDGTDLSASCEVTVNAIPVESISLNTANLTLYIHDTFQLIVTVSPSEATNTALAWTTDNDSVAVVSSEGLVTPMAPGSATITVTTTDGTDLSATCKVTVITLIGDVNGDGEVNIADINTLNDIILGGHVDELTRGRADVNGDHEVSIADVNAVIDIILSK